nr:FAD:protein FMN transferase [Massilia sp. TS11]
MGCSWSLRLAAASPALDALRNAIQAELDQIVAEMSHWEPESTLCRFNHAPAGSRHRLPPRFAQVMDAALALARQTGGAYDPAAGALVNAWGFGPGEAYAKPGYTPPAPAECAALTQSWALLDWRAQPGELLQPGGVLLDLSSIAKGYAVDRMAEILLARGYQHFLVELGGELRGHGCKPDGQPWWVEVENPPELGEQAALLALHGLSIATSGDYRRWTEIDGERLSHTLDPRVGRPITHGLASVSVVHPSCMQADALSTAINVLGPEAGLRFAEHLGLPARLVWRTESGLQEASSSAWERLAS